MTTNNIIIGIFVLVVVAGVGYIFAMSKDNAPKGYQQHGDEAVESYEIHPADVAEKIKNSEDVVLLDVRTPEEYAEMHLEDAVLLPVQELSRQSLAAIGLGEDTKNKEIIIYCRSGARSKTAYDIMNSLGYTNIKSIAGGIINWQEGQYPFTESGAYTGRESAE
ncbi:MAG: rhodanese-like domain-containing protein [Patescibacteria group bacterium]|nr:rhodanese-like domain-containing protein [Patescibacteria group bacterium]